MFTEFKTAVGRLAPLAAVAALAASPLAVCAQPAVGYTQPPAPSIKGTIASIPGKYQIEVRDRLGDLDDVTLHDGTIINPTGITLQPGFRVAIYGRPSAGTFVADEIDTPYHYVQPQYAYYPYPDYAPFYPGYLWYAAPPVFIVNRGPR
jgi:hypothetical protein